MKRNKGNVDVSMIYRVCVCVCVLGKGFVIASFMSRIFKFDQFELSQSYAADSVTAVYFSQNL